VATTQRQHPGGDGDHGGGRHPPGCPRSWPQARQAS